MANFSAVNDSLKEFGDLANWAAVLEADMTAIAQSLATTVAARQQQQAEDRRRTAAQQPQSAQPPATASTPTASAGSVV